MRNIPEAFKQATSNNRKKYTVRAVLTLADTNHTTLTLTNAELWDGGGFAMEDAVSEDNKFTALGSTIIGTARLSIKNLNEEYSIYDFTDATALISLGIADTGENPVLIGTYTVDECSFTDGAISLTLLDNMEKLDRPYTGNPTYPATLYQIVQSACLGKVQFQPQTSANPFPHHDFQLATEFDSDGLTCREVVGMVAAIAGCYAKCTPDGKVTFGWFDYAALNSWITAYSGGTTPSSAILARMHYITSVFSQDIAVDPVTITGVRLTYEVTDNDGKKIEQVATAGQEGYVVGFEKNNVLNACTSNQITQIKNWLGTQFIGMTFRKASLSHSSNMAIEAGDVAAVWDRKGRGYPILITRTNFTAFDQQKTVSGAETPLRNNATRYSWQSKAYLEMQKQINEEKSLRMLAEEEIRNAVASASGMYYHAVTDEQSNSTIYYLHNRAELAKSPVRIMFSDAGIQMTSNGTDASPTWYGLTPGGTMYANLMAAITIAFDQAQGGVLTLGGNGNGNGILLLKDENGENIAKMNNGGLVVYKGTIQGPNITVGGNGSNPPILYIRDSNGTQLANWTVNGIKMFATDGTTVIGQWNHNGIDIRSGTISGGTISGGVINGPNITVGGTGSSPPILYIRDEDGTQLANWTKEGIKMFDTDGRTIIGQWNHDGIKINKGEITGITVSGSTLKGGIFTGTDLGTEACETRLAITNEQISGTNYYAANMRIYNRYSPGLGIYISPAKSGNVTSVQTPNNSLIYTKSIPLELVGYGNNQGQGRTYLRLGNNDFRLYAFKSGTSGESVGFTANSSGLSIYGGDTSSYYADNVTIGTYAGGGNIRLYPAGKAYYAPNGGTESEIAVVSSSSRRYKHDIHYGLTGDRGEDALLELAEAEFIFNDDHGVQYRDMKGRKIPGFIAEDVAEKYPSAAIYNEDGTVESWDERRILPGMLALIKKQNKRIEELETKEKERQKTIREQADKISSLEERLSRLERLIEGMA